MHSMTAFFVDFAKAFDWVPPIPLLHEPGSYDIYGQSLTFVGNFLAGFSFNIKPG